MRDLTSGDLGMLLSVFALLLIAFGVDFSISRKDAQRHHARSLLFAVVSLTGELSTAIALVLTWTALWSPAAWERIDDLMVFIPGSIAVLSAVALAFERVVSHVMRLHGSKPGGDHDRSEPTQPADDPNSR